MSLIEYNNYSIIAIRITVIVTTRIVTIRGKTIRKIIINYYHY